MAAAVTEMSRVAGFVTHGPSMMRDVFAAASASAMYTSIARE